MTNDRSRTIAVIGTGDMGSAVGAALVRAGFKVVTDGSARSAHSRALAERAGIEDLRSLRAAVGAADLVLSIVPPAAAASVAAQVAAESTGIAAPPAFVDCNAVAPATVRAMACSFEPRAPFVDAGIVGRAPRPGAPPTRFYVSGRARRKLLEIATPEIRMIDMGEEIGAASAIKMAYAALNKGTDALHTAVLLAAERLGVRGELMRELAVSQAEALHRMTGRVPYLAATAARYVGEMREIAATYESVGVTPFFHRGAEWVFEQLATTPYAAETRATLPRERSLDEAVPVFSAALDRAAAADGRAAR